MDFQKCSQTSTNPLIVVKENGREFRIKNSKGVTVTKVNVDGCLINDSRERCDYVFEFGSACHCAVYVELKGADIEKALSQLLQTLDYLKTRHNCKKICHIVASRVPKAGPKVQLLKASVAKKYGVQLFVGTQKVAINAGDSPYD